jgi:hypothetical protein
VRGLGYIPDVPDLRDWQAELLPDLAGAAQVPDSFEMTKFIDRVRDQLATSTCVGQADARFVHMRALFCGIQIPFPSALAIYTVARRDDPNLLDVGCRPRDAATGMRMFGLVAEERWPFDPAKVAGDAARVPWDVLTAGYDAKLDGYYRIGGSGEERCDFLRQALAAGYPIAYAQQVDDALNDYTGGVLGSFRGPSRGGHMTNLIGYSRKDGWFLGLNSWGTGWGEGGLYKISDERVGSDACSDFYACTVAPRRIR